MKNPETTLPETNKRPFLWISVINCPGKAEYLSGHASSLPGLFIAFQCTDDCNVDVCRHRYAPEHCGSMASALQEPSPGLDEPDIFCFFDPVVSD